MAKKHKSRGSAEAEKHPYLRLSFWLRSENQFWERETYSEETKQRFRDILQRWAESQKNLSTIEPTLR